MKDYHVHQLLNTILFLLQPLFSWYFFEGLLCNCVLPAGLNETKVRHVRAEEVACDKKKLRSHSSRYPASNSAPSLSSQPSGYSTRGGRQRNRLASSSLNVSTVPPTMKV